MNYLWAGMMLVAIVYGAVHGTIPEVTQAALDSSKEAVTLCITMLGILSFWMGLMQVASASGLIERMTRGIRPVLQWLFPRIPKGHPVASDEMCVFLILNISSLQLIPMNVVAYRSQYGSVNPTAIVGPAILATAVSTLAGVIFCKVMDGKRRA